MEYTDFKKDFPKRTIDILNGYKCEYNVTLLLNCLLALLVLPKEKFYDNIPEEIPPDWGLTKEHIQKVQCQVCGYKLKNIVLNMRHAIAHLDVKTTKDYKGNIEKVRFKNRSKFIAEIPVGDLKTFVIKLTKYVIESEKNQNQRILCSN